MGRFEIGGTFSISEFVTCALLPTQSVQCAEKKPLTNRNCANLFVSDSYFFKDRKSHFVNFVILIAMASQMSPDAKLPDIPLEADLSHFNMEFIPCQHSNRRFCNCLKKHQIENQLFLKHVEKICLQTSAHGAFKQDGYFSIDQRPTWKYNCRLQLTEMDIFYVDYLCRVFNLNCTCESQRICQLCQHLCPAHISVPPSLFLGVYNNLRLKDIHFLAPFIHCRNSGIPFSNAETTTTPPSSPWKIH